MRQQSLNMIRFARVGIQQFFIWVLILSSGLLLLYGRYDWSADVQRFAVRGFFTSGYIMVVLLPTLYYVVRAMTQRPHAAMIVTTIAFLIVTLPYRWLGLDRFSYYDHNPQWYTIGSPGTPIPETEWFPAGLAKLPAIPYEGLFFGLLIVVGAVVAGLSWQRGPHSIKLWRNRVILVFFLAYTLILLQSWLHLSMRSPFTYLPHYVKSRETNYWYHVYMFPEGKGAVIADQFVGAAIEDYFTGAPRDGNNMMIRRSMSFYIVSQFSYFINSYYVFLVLNIIFWFSAVICGYLFTRNIWCERVARLSAALIACGSGFIMSVSTPTFYMINYASIIIVLFFFQYLFVNKPQSIKSFLVFGAFLGVISMIYDIFPLYLVLIGYGWSTRVRFRFLLLSFMISLVIYGGFLALHDNILQIPVVPTNIIQAENARDNIINLLRDPSLNKWYSLMTTLSELYWGNLSRMFFVLPILPALFGIAQLRNRTESILISLLFVMSFITVSFLFLGQQWFANNPRFVYVSYPAIYILVALALDRFAHFGVGSRFEILMRSTPWIFIGVMFVLHNIDVFGFPAMYVEGINGLPPVFYP